MYRRILLVCVWTIVLVSTAMWAQRRSEPDVMSGPLVLTGENIGIRVAAYPDQGGKVVGRLVVKINGQWVDVVAPAGVVPVGK